MGVELLGVEFGFFLISGPEDRAPFGVHLPHVLFGFLFGELEDDFKDVGDIAHEVDGVVMDHDMPYWVERVVSLVLT